MNEMGLGKTLCMLGLFVKTCRSGHVNLVVCPATLVTTWANEISKHLDIDTSRVTVIKSVADAKTKTFDNTSIVIVSYTLLTRLDEASKLLNTSFKRVVLDEAHYLRNTTTCTFKKVQALKRDNTWVMTATPIFNSHDDMFAYYNLLGLEGNDTIRDWRDNVSKDVSGMRVINKWNKKYGLQMKKRDVMANVIQEPIYKTYNVEFTRDERKFYELFTDLTMTKITTLQRLLQLQTTSSELKKKMSAHVLTLIMRLKQCCCNPYMAAMSLRGIDTSGSFEEITHNLEYYMSQRNIEEECPICFDKCADKILNPCGHKFCGDCCDSFVDAQGMKCPMCRHVFDRIDDVSGDVPRDVSSDVSFDEQYVSTKFLQALDIVRNAISNNEKVVVVSQWCKSLELFENALVRSDITTQHVKLIGGMSKAKRQGVIDTFQRDDSINVCMLSLLSGAEGITLTSANHIVCLDTWWNSSKMEQCFARIHRIGQDKQVYIHQMTVPDTIEPQINKLVKKKSKITSITLSDRYVNNETDNTQICEKIKLV